MRGLNLISLILAIVLILGFALVPAPSHRSPAYDVWVVSESGHHPLGGVEVTERYGLDDPQTRTSDAQGHVRFESRVVPGTSLAHRLVTRRSVKIPAGANNFTTIKAVGRGFGMSTETMTWAGPPGAMGMRITMYPN